jgi:hypothetical protein
MRMARGAAASAVAVALVLATTGAAAPPGPVAWTPALDSGQTAGVELTGGTLRLVPPRPLGTARTEAASRGRPGLLTLPARTLDVAVDRVDAALDADPGAGEVAVDVRGRRAGGGWTEWVPAEPPPRSPGPASAVLLAPVEVVQARVVLTAAPDGDPARGPVVRALTLTAHPARGVRAQEKTQAATYRVFATREGLVGGTTANGHVVAERDMFVALPSRRALSPRHTSDYSVKICTAEGRCAFAPVWDVGPWNTRDDYWNPPDRRENWADLPQGLPQAQAAKESGYNGGKDQFGRTVLNPAGIDLADGLFWDALGLTDNAWVTVDYLWTGDSPLAIVDVDVRVELRAAPDPAARIVGLVADLAAVPVQCRVGPRVGGWLRIGPGLFLPARSVPRPGRVPACPGPAAG